MEAMRGFMNQALVRATQHWKYISPVLSYPKNESHYNTLINRLDELLDIVKNNEKHPLIGLVDALSHLIASYEEAHVKKITTKGIDALKFLMESHQVHQSDLSEIASQGVISEILNGKRSLNLRQIKLLSKRFHVSPATFIDE